MGASDHCSIPAQVSHMESVIAKSLLLRLSLLGIFFLVVLLVIGVGHACVRTQFGRLSRTCCRQDWRANCYPWVLMLNEMKQTSQDPTQNRQWCRTETCPECWTSSCLLLHTSVRARYLMIVIVVSSEVVTSQDLIMLYHNGYCFKTVICNSYM